MGGYVAALLFNGGRGGCSGGLGLDNGLDIAELEVGAWPEEGLDIATGVLRPESILAKLRKMKRKPTLYPRAPWPYFQPSQVKNRRMQC